MKLCKDCKHYQFVPYPKMGVRRMEHIPHRCWIGVSFITGEKYFLDAGLVRPNEKVCGIEEAKQFEPAEALDKPQNF